MDADPHALDARHRESELLRALGDRLRLHRARRGMTRRALAQASGVSERYIAQTEGGQGNVSVLLLHAISGALGVAPADLLADPPETEPADRLLARLPEAQRREARRMLIERYGADPHCGERIALIGLRGAGKSSLGRLLAERIRAPFFELDREIERASGIELRDLFERDGQSGFRRIERAVLERLIREQPRAVIATGGGIVAEPRTYDALLAHCRTIWIRASPAEHMQRVIDQGDLRPMADNRQAMADLRAILASREALYARADATLDTSGRTLDASFADLLALVREAGRAWASEGEMTHDVAYKVMTARELEQFEREGRFHGSSPDLADGFIHLSTGAQLAATIDRHFSGRAGLALAVVDLARLGGALRWESSRGGQLFPHLYGVLSWDAVVASGPLERADDGSVRIPR